MQSWRNVFYSSREQKIILWTWDDKGKRIKIETSFEPHLYIESKNHQDAVSIFNTSLKRLTFKNQFERSKFANETPISRLFHNINCEQQFLLQMYKEENQKPDFAQFPLKIFHLDIETYNPEKFATPEEASNPINLITIYDSLSEIYHTWGLGEYKSKHEKEIYYFCKSEQVLLQKFLAFWEEDFPDIVAGWNIMGYDIPYLINRITNLFGKEEASRLSPVGVLYYRENVGRDKFGKVINKWHIRGLSLIDSMEVYITFARGSRESYSLGYIGEYELGESKTNTNGMNLAQLSQENWSLFVEYNIQDVKLLVQLEEKLKFLRLVRTMSYTGFIPFEQSLGKVSMVTGAVANQAMKMGFVIPTFKNLADRIAYEGGYVHEPERGLHNGVISYDANSLYPNTIITLNISPETKIGRITSRTAEEITILLANYKSVTLSKDKYDKLVRQEKLSISKYDVLYTQKFKGVIPLLIERYYSDRVKAQKELKACKKKIIQEKDAETVIKLKQRISDLDSLQHTLKIYLNSLYGIFAQKFSPLFDIDHSGSITLTGQNTIKQASEIAFEYAKKNGFNGKKEDVYLYSDTDSIFISLNTSTGYDGELSEKDGELTVGVKEKLAEFDNHLNVEIKAWAQKELNSLDPRLVFKREAVCDKAVFMEKKRYILHVINQEDVPSNYFKYVGVEIARSTMSKEVKELVKAVLENAILNGDRKTANAIYQKAYADYQNLPIEAQAFRSKISDLEKQELKRGEHGEIGKHTPSHAKSAIYYNDFLKKLQIDSKYPAIGSGIKMKWFYAAKNPYNLKNMGFIDVYPPEVAAHVQPDMQKMFDKSVAPPITRLYECINWQITQPGHETTVDLFELFA